MSSDKILSPMEDEELVQLFQSESFTNCMKRVLHLDVTEQLIQRTLKSFSKESKTSTNEKCHRTAKELRIEGNKYFKNKNFEKALDLYNKALTFSDLKVDEDGVGGSGGNSEYVLCLANRSAVHYHLHHYQFCINDVQNSLAHNYQPAHKLVLRRAQCFFHLDNFSEAKNDLMVLKMAAQRGTQPEEVDDWLRKIELQQQQKQPQQPQHHHLQQSRSEHTREEILKVKGGKSDALMQASRCVCVQFSEEKTRYLVARGELEEGDVLIVERPFVCLLLPPYYHSRCFNCLGDLENFYPCLTCRRVRYCSGECRSEAWRSHHHIECPYMEMLESFGIAHLAFRILAVAKLDHILPFKDTSKKEKVSSNDENFIPSSCTPLRNNYAAVFHLIHNKQHAHVRDLWTYAMTASVLLRCLEESSFFEGYKNLEEDYEDFRAFIGGLLLRHICQLICNAHAVNDLELTQLASSSLVDSEQQVRIATAIYPTASLMNHSCDPNTISCFHGDTLLVRALKRIKPGEEIFNCYGPHYKRMSRSDRQEALLSQYSFTCLCTACERENKHDDDDDDDDDDDLKHVSTIAPCDDVFICKSCQGRLVRFSHHHRHHRRRPHHRHSPTHKSSSKQASSGDSISDNVISSRNISSTDDGDDDRMVRYVCVDCKTRADENHSMLISKGFDESNALFELANDHLRRGNTNEAYGLFERCCSLRKAIYQPMSIQVANVLDALAQSSSINGDFPTSQSHLKCSLSIVEHVYGRQSIEHANEVRKYSEVCWQAGSLEEARDSAGKALRMFEVLYGHEHKSCHELRNAIASMNLCIL